MNIQIGKSTHDTVLVHRFSLHMQMALTYANEVEAVPVSSSRFHTIKAPCISHTTNHFTNHFTTCLNREHITALQSKIKHLHE